MKTRLLAKYVGLLISGLFVLLGSTSVFADAGDTISNLATISYQVGSVNQPVIESSPTGNTTSGVGNGTSTDFLEDREINFSVAEAGVIGYAVGAAGQSDVALQFTLTNNSNATLDFLLAAIDTDLDTHNGGAADNIDANNVVVFVEDGTTPGYQLAEDTAVFVDELTEGASVTVYVVGDIPAGATNGQTAGYALAAQVAAGGAVATEGAAITNDDNGNISPAGTYSNGGTVVVAGTANDIADAVGTMETVFNDPAGAAAEDESTAGAQDIAQNGQASDADAFQANAAALTITKTSAVISDPVNGVTNPKAIPGAVIEYTLTIANAAGAGDADLVAITDNLNTQISTDGSIAWVTDSMVITSPDAGAAQALTDAADADEGEFNDTAGNREISADCGTLSAGESCILIFQVTVQ
ncbi:MAG: hypothetical protein JXA04_03195 [Gammaproteobacteria bacterium]|nr:hypothetical protein [Gammaproteobacteria bacterium]